MKKIIKQWGNSKVIVINSEEAEIYEINPGDLVEVKLEKVKVLKHENN